MEKNRVKNYFPFAKISKNLKISFRTYSLANLKISAQKNFGNSSKADLKFFVKLAVTQTQNSKGRKIFQGRKFENRYDTIARIHAI